VDLPAAGAIEIGAMTSELNLPDRIYLALLKAASDSGTTPAAWIAERLPSIDQDISPTEEEIQAANARLRACIVDFGHEVGVSNESIDADLAREYGADHPGFNSPSSAR
jgi:hypothetical protein